MMQTDRSAAARLIIVIHDPLRSIFKGSTKIRMIRKRFNKVPTVETARAQIQKMSRPLGKMMVELRF